jgi:uncharacterized membrane protein YeaQ/YmgE (transglycosylase-associated protein family)
MSGNAFPETTHPPWRGIHNPIHVTSLFLAILGSLLLIAANDFLFVDPPFGLPAPSDLFVFVGAFAGLVANGLAPSFRASRFRVRWIEFWGVVGAWLGKRRSLLLVFHCCARIPFLVRKGTGRARAGTGSAKA